MKDKIEFKILPFKEYLKLRTSIKKLPGELNRPVADSHVDSLRTIIEKNGFDDIFKIIRTKVFSQEGKYELYCGDGNHRMKAIEDLSLDQQIPLCIITINSLENIIDRVATWNNSGKKWVAHQYLNTWACAGYPDYVGLKEVTKRYKYSLASLIDAFGGSRKDSYKKDFEEGKFILDRKKGENIICLYIDAIMAGIKDSPGAFSAVARFYTISDFRPEVLIEVIQKRKYELGGATNRDKVLNIFREHYKKIIDSSYRKALNRKEKALLTMQEQ